MLLHKRWSRQPRCPACTAHPPLLDADDSPLARLRTLALALPEAAEKISHGRSAFCTQEVFAYYGGATKEEHRQGLQPRA